MIGGRLLVLALAALLATAAAAADPPVRVGLLKFGTVAWEIDTIRRHGLDRAQGIDVTAVEFATNEAAKVALQAGAVEMIVTDWPWVNRQRAEGADLTFVPFSKAVGALMVLKGAGTTGLSDLRGRRIGVVGGPLDKSWLILRALARKELGADLAEIAEPVFGAPPLLHEQLLRGRIDAILTYWHDAARLAASGARPVLSVSDAIRRLGIEAEVPMLGYTFRESWAAAHGDAIRGFVAASRQAKAVMAGSAEEWTRLAPQVGSSDPAILEALRTGFAAGIPDRWGAPERAGAGRLYDILVQLGGQSLVGSAETLDHGTFWTTGSD